MGNPKKSEKKCLQIAEEEFGNIIYLSIYLPELGFDRHTIIAAKLVGMSFPLANPFMT